MSSYSKYKLFSGKSKKNAFVNKYGRNPVRRDRDYNINWYDIEHDIADKLWEIHRNDSMASQCREYLMGFLGTKMEFKQNEKTISPSPEFERVLQSEWSPFITDLYDTLFILGIAPITFQKSLVGDNDYIPRVLEPGTYRIQVAFIKELESKIFRVLVPSDHFFNADKNTTDTSNKNSYNSLRAISFTMMNKINAFSRHSSMRTSGYSIFKKTLKPAFMADMPQNWILDRNSIVLHGFGYDPSIYGIINSRLKSILEYSEFTAIQGRLMVLNQLRLTSRPIFIQQNDPPDPNKNKPDLSFTSTKHKKDQWQQKKREDELEALKELAAQYAGNTEAMIMQDPNSQARGLMDRVQQDSISRLLVGDTVAPVSIAPLPQGYILPSGQKPDVTLGMRFFDCDTELQPKKAAAYGIPIDLIQSRGVVRSNTAAQIEMFQQSVRRWMNVIGEILTHCYNSIYGNEDRRGLLAEYLERYSYDVDIMDKIQKFIIDDWRTNEGEMTKFQNVYLHQKQKPSKSSSSSQDDEKSPKEGSKKRDRSESSDKTKSAKEPGNFEKKLKTNQFDPMIQLKTHLEEKAQKEQKLLKNIDFMKPVEVKLAGTSSLMLDMLAYIYAQGGLLDKEYFLALRNRADYQTDDKIIKQLVKQRDKLQGLDQVQKPASSSKKKSSSGKKTKAKPKKKPAASKEKKDKPGPDPKAGLPEDETRGRDKDIEGAKKKKLASDMTKSKESNMKREMSAHKSQAANAKVGSMNTKK